MAHGNQKMSKKDAVFTFVNYALLCVFALIIIYPLYYILIASISDPNATNAGQVIWKPVRITFEGYQLIFEDSSVWSGYRNSILYTLCAVAVNMFVTIPAAFTLSRKEVPGRNFCMLVITLTMFFSGGMVPTYIVVKDLGLINSPLAVILPTAVITYYLIVTRTFFQTTIPEEIREAAFVDGAGWPLYFFKIALPLSKPILAVMLLFHTVHHWNSYFQAMIYLQDEKLYPLQLILRNILVDSEASMADDASAIVERQRQTELIKYGMVIFASLPMLVAYPFVQKYFVQGMMIGAVKG